MQKLWLACLLVVVFSLASCSPTFQIQQALDEAFSLTQAALPTLTPSLTPTDTPLPTNTWTPSVTPSRTPTFTSTPSLTPTPTDTPTLTDTPLPPPTDSPTPGPSPTPSRTPTRTQTPTKTKAPTRTPTPILPSLAGIILTSADLNQAGVRWLDPPVNISRNLKDTTSTACLGECIGYRWTSTNKNATLTIVLYREASAEEAAYSATGARKVYVQDRNYLEEKVDLDGVLTVHTWVAQRDQFNLVLFSSQGPAVFSLFWESQVPINLTEAIPLIVSYAKEITIRLENAGYLNPKQDTGLDIVP